MNSQEVYNGQRVFWAGIDTKNEEPFFLLRCGQIVRVYCEGNKCCVEADDGQTFYPRTANLKASREEAQAALERMVQKLEEARR